MKVADLLWRVRNLHSNHSYMIFCYFNTDFRKRKGEKAQVMDNDFDFEDEFKKFRKIAKEDSDIMRIAKEMISDAEVSLIRKGGFNRICIQGKPLAIMSALEDLSVKGINSVCENEQFDKQSVYEAFCSNVKEMLKL